MKTLKILTLVLLFSGASLAQQGTRFSYKLLPETVPQSVTVHLDSAQIVNLFTTKVQLVPAAGIDTVIIPIVMIFSYFGQGHAGYVSNSGSINLFYDTNLYVGMQSTNALNATTDQMTVAFTLASMENTSIDYSLCADEPLMLGRITDDYSGGGGSLDIQIQYIKVKK